VLETPAAKEGIEVVVSKREARVTVEPCRRQTPCKQSRPRRSGWVENMPRQPRRALVQRFFELVPPAGRQARNETQSLGDARSPGGRVEIVVRNRPTVNEADYGDGTGCTVKETG
jgi:hypothetical protein